MLMPNVDIEKFEEFGFKLCRGIPRDLQCYYLCVARGCEFIFVSPKCFAIEEWRKDDSRIHTRPNCIRGKITAIDVLYDLIKAGMLRKEG